MKATTFRSTVHQEKAAEKLLKVLKKGAKILDNDLALRKKARVESGLYTKTDILKPQFRY